MAAQLSACTSCDAPIYWLQNMQTLHTGPINAAPEPEGKGNILVDTQHGAYYVVPEEQRGAYGDTLHTSHFQTCPNRERHRRKTRTTPKRRGEAVLA